MDTMFLKEPLLRFGHDQALEDPRDGLTLFGPLDEGKPFGIRAGVIGTRQGIQYFSAWSQRIQGPLQDATSPRARPTFPGFEAAFRIPWRKKPVSTIEIDHVALINTANLDDGHQRVYQSVNLFADRLIASRLQDDTAIDVWFVVIPDIVHTNCRPRSRIPLAQQVKSQNRLNPRSARRLASEPSLFSEDNKAALPYEYEVDFHHQLKARLLAHGIPTQIVRESTIAPVEGRPGIDRPKRDVSGFQAAIAWNLSTAAFFKAGGRPWKVEGVRDGVCYIGLVFKQDQKHADPRTACCAAQMFLDSGDGVVFRGAVGPWHTPGQSDFHLSRVAARELIGVALEAYTQKHGSPPAELFLHGRVRFNEEEWKGFQSMVDSTKTKLVGVQIRDENDFRLYHNGSLPVLRGIAACRDANGGYLWTRGYTPRLGTYVGREVPRPLRVEIARGSADLRTVLSDVLALTKLNYNTCLYSDGSPVTLRFANAIGEILTAGPLGQTVPLSFRYYI